MAIRSDLPRGVRWATRLLAFPILGASVLAAIGWLMLKDIENDNFEWLNSPWTRGALFVGLLGFAVWLSMMLSKDPARVELDGTTLLLYGIAGGRVRRESLQEIRQVHPDGHVEFLSGRRILLASHPRILEELRRWMSEAHRS